MIYHSFWVLTLCTRINIGYTFYGTRREQRFRFSEDVNNNDKNSSSNNSDNSSKGCNINDNNINRSINDHMSHVGVFTFWLRFRTEWISSLFDIAFNNDEKSLDLFLFFYLLCPGVSRRQLNWVNIDWFLVWHLAATATTTQVSSQPSSQYKSASHCSICTCRWKERNQSDKQSLPVMSMKPR